MTDTAAEMEIFEKSIENSNWLLTTPNNHP